MKSVPTWVWEFSVVAIILFVVAGISGSWVEFIGSGAVLAGFAHGQIADRLHENTPPAKVPCKKLMWRYWIAKEIGWVTYFLLHQSYAALVGAGLFACYPLWRRWWRYRPGGKFRKEVS